MAQIVGYKLIGPDGAVVEQWGGVWGQCPGVPNPIMLPNGDQVCAASPGDTFQGYTLTPWTMEDSEKPPVVVFSGVEFLKRFTDAEYGAILSAAQSSVQIAKWLDIFRLLGEVDVTGNTAKAAKQGLVAAGLLTQDRADIIFRSE